MPGTAPCRGWCVSGHLVLSSYVLHTDRVGEKAGDRAGEETGRRRRRRRERRRGGKEGKEEKPQEEERFCSCANDIFKRAQKVRSTQLRVPFESLPRPRQFAPLPWQKCSPFYFSFFLAARTARTSRNFFTVAASGTFSPTRSRPSKSSWIFST